MALHGYSKNASDLVAIVTTIGGYNRRDLLLRCALRQRDSERNINTTTVCSVLDEMLREARGANFERSNIHGNCNERCRNQNVL